MFAPNYTKVAYDFLRLAVATSAVWVPLVFAAYWMGRRRVGRRFFFAFMAAEGVALLMANWIHNGWWHAHYRIFP